MDTKINSYLDALHYNGGEPLVLALTGYTGVGCSTTREILQLPSKPQIPGFAAVGTPESVTPMAERVHAKLTRAWADTGWEPAVSIEVSKIIFAFMVDALRRDPALHVMYTHGAEISERIKSEELALEGLHHLASERGPVSVDEAHAMIAAYEASKRVYKHFKETFVRKELGDFIELLQDCGDEIRRYGRVGTAETNRKITPSNIFSLPIAISRLIRAFSEARGCSTFVIDSIKNPYEIEYLRRQYSNFYVIALMRDADTRHKSLLEKLDAESVEKINRREKAEAFKHNEKITSQDIDECVRRADMFIDNQESGSGAYEHLRFGVIKLLTLAKRPGCVTPTQDERCMQLAMTVRLASGCISRQVGAVVVDNDRRICGVGWNDPPRGQVPCSLRTCDELVNNATPKAFSEYERTKPFVARIASLPQKDDPFCFRTELGVMNGKKEAEYTRALHAEENALIQAVSGTTRVLEAATLYTTARTCNLCAKKAYQLGVTRIVFIDEYYDIAIQQTIRAGTRVVAIERFSGIIGGAYHRLYSTPMPEKTMIGLRHDIVPDPTKIGAQSTARTA